jgi:hypothetical protein
MSDPLDNPAYYLLGRIAEVIGLKEGDPPDIVDAVERMTRDAKRYAWLRDRQTDVVDDLEEEFVLGRVSQVYIGKGDGSSAAVTGEELDAAIDAEMRRWG